MRRLLITMACMLLMLLFPYASFAQATSPEELSTYFQKHDAAVEGAVRGFNDFRKEMASTPYKAAAVKNAISYFQTKASALEEVVNNMRPLGDDVWYLPKLKTFAEVMANAAKVKAPDLIRRYEAGSWGKDLENEYNALVDKIELAREHTFWGRHRLVAASLFKKGGEPFCQSSQLLIAEARNRFKNLKGAPIPGKANAYSVTALLMGSLSGEILVEDKKMTVRYLMFKHKNKQEAYQKFNDMAYYLLSCDLGDKYIRGKSVFLDSPGNEVEFTYWQKDPGVTVRIAFEKENVDNSNEGWAVYMVYELPTGS